MKKITSAMLAMAVTIMMVCGIFQTPVSAATRKCYTICTGNTVVYSNSSLTGGRYGLIYDTDELIVLNVTARSSYVSYPISGGRMKTGYINTSAILTGTNGNSYRASTRITTYRRPGGASYGYIDPNDVVTVLGTYGDYTQVKYPVSGGYKYAFVTNDNARNYITGSNSQSSASYQTSSSWTSPMRNMYICGNGWGTYYSYGPNGRKYHCGLDLASSSGDTSIYAAASGVVVYSGYSSGNGNHIIIQHSLSGRTVYTLYSHLSRYYVGRGSSVSAGQQIGVWGSTGNSTGNHLHFAVFSGYSSDPYGYITYFNGNTAYYNGYTFYNPTYVINYGRLP